MDVNELLKYMVSKEGSDLHLCAGRRPYIRLYGELVNTEFDTLRPDEVKSLIYSILKKEQIQALETRKELDIAYMIPDFYRFRVNVYIQRGTLGAVIRAVPFSVSSFEELGVPTVVKRFIDNMHGLMLVTGPQGSGKTTTLAAIVDYINTTRKAHILTVEDPIEYLHRSKRSVVNQREIGTDTASYRDAMKYILRQDTDVCIIGEMRDADSIMTALNLAEAGMLVLSTLHSSCAPKAISKIVDMFTPDYQQQIRIQLSLVLIAVISQQLIPRQDKVGRILACEVMKKTDSIENLIRNYSIKQIQSFIQTGREEGMWTMDQHLFDLYTWGKISKYELCRRVSDLGQVEKWIEELG